MSNHLAIATVTAALRQLLYDAVSLDVSGAEVSILPPDDASLKSDAPRLNLFLYQVTPNSGWANADLPVMRQDGSIAANPRLGLNLHYLLSAYGKAATDDPEVHRVLGSAVRTLHEQPILTRDEIRASAQLPALAGSDLADQVEMIKLAPQGLSVEELSKLWAVFQAPYRICVAYTASVVLIDGRKKPRPVLPVRERGIYVSTFRRPEITGVEPQSLEYQIGAKLTIRGYNLRADQVKVCLGGIEVAPDDPIGEASLTVSLPDGLRAGVNSLYVTQKRMMGVPPTAHRGFESNVTACVIKPRILGDSPFKVVRGTVLELVCDPPVGSSQRVSLLVGDHEIELAPRSADSATLEIPILADFPPGSFLLRLRVDGAESVLQASDPRNPVYVGPVLEVTST